MVGSSTSTDLYLGRVFGAYRVDSQLGRGAIGTVYRATHLTLERPAALKLLPVNEDPHSVARFEREARAAARLQDPNVARIFEFGSQEGVHFIAQELVEGVSFAQRLEQETKLPLEEVCALGVAIASGLHAIHKANLVHRDLKPENVILTPTAGAKIVDFGLVRIVGDKSTHLTRSGSIVGTPLYMAPEQIEGGVVGAAADVFALGCILVRALLGRAPHDTGDQNLRAFMQRRMTIPVEDLGARRPDLPAEVASTIESMLRLDPLSRPTAREVQRSLNDGRRKVGDQPAAAAVTTKVYLGPISARLEEGKEPSDTTLRRLSICVGVAGVLIFALALRALMGRVSGAEDLERSTPAAQVDLGPAAASGGVAPEPEPTAAQAAASDPEPETPAEPEVALGEQGAGAEVAGADSLDEVLEALRELRLDDAEEAVAQVRDANEAQTARWLIGVLRTLNQSGPLVRGDHDPPGDWSSQAPRVAALVEDWEPGLSTYGFARFAAEQRNQIALVIHVSRYERLRRQRGLSSEPEDAGFLQQERREELSLLLQLGGVIPLVRRAPGEALEALDGILASSAMQTPLARELEGWLRMVRVRVARRAAR